MGTSQQTSKMSAYAVCVCVHVCMYRHVSTYTVYNTRAHSFVIQAPTYTNRKVERYWIPCFSPCYEQMPDQQQFKGQKIYPGSWLMGCSSSAWEGTAAAAQGGSVSPTECEPEAETSSLFTSWWNKRQQTVNASTHPIFPFSSVWAPMMVPAVFQVRLLPSVNVHTSECLDDSNPGPANEEDQPSQTPISLSKLSYLGNGL